MRTGLLVLDGNLDHGAEVVVVAAAHADVAGIDAVLGQGAGALGVLLQQDVSVVVKVANDGDGNPELIELLDNARDGGSGSVIVHRDAHQFRSGAGQGRSLLDGAFDVGGIGIGHRLHDHGGIAAHLHLADGGRNCFSATYFRHAGHNFSMCRERCRGGALSGLFTPAIPPEALGPRPGERRPLPVRSSSHLSNGMQSAKKNPAKAAGR